MEDGKVATVTVLQKRQCEIKEFSIECTEYSHKIVVLVFFHSLYLALSTRACVVKLLLCTYL